MELKDLEVYPASEELLDMVWRIVMDWDHLEK
jgi:hypothetical protein